MRLCPDQEQSHLVEYNHNHDKNGEFSSGGSIGADLPGFKMLKPGDELVKRKNPWDITTRMDAGEYRLSFDHGYLVLTDTPDKPQDYLYITGSQVDDGYRRKGWGQKLYSAGVALAKSLGKKGITGGSYQTPEAKAFWGKQRSAGRVTRGTYQDSMVDVLENFQEYNHNHRPAGPGGGQFDHSSGHGPLSVFSHSPHSARIPGYLKKDVAAAAMVGIETFHHQQPEPVRGIDGVIYDPLAKSHSNRSEGLHADVQGTNAYYHRARVFLSTRGGEFEPTYEEWNDKFGMNRTRKTKPYTPADLKDPASKADVLSTFRHEVGHIMNRDFKDTKNTPHELASEITAWQYAVEMSPSHRISASMALSGLRNHAYGVFRGQTLIQTKLKDYPRYDYDKLIGIHLSAELDRGEIDPAAMTKAQHFADHVVKSLQNYGRVLRKRGAPATEPVFHPWYSPNNGFPRDLGMGGRGTL